MQQEKSYEQIQKKLYKNITYRGEIRVNALLPYSQERHLSLQRGWVKFEISIMTIFHVKRINIEASKVVAADVLFDMVSNFLKYECLYDGRFFESKEILLDGEDVTVVMEKEALSYYSGINSYVQLAQPSDVKTYKTGFCAWEYLSKTMYYPDQMYFDLAFSNNVKADLRLVLFTQALDAFAMKMNTEGPIGINPENESSTSEERLKNLIKEYGDDIFEGDNLDELFLGIENSKKKVLFMQPLKRGALTLRQCELYVKKMTEMYRVIMLQRSGMFNKEAALAVKEECREFNALYASTDWF